MRRVEVRIEPNLHAHGDRRLLGDMLRNLLSNAWKFTSKTDNARIEVGRASDGVLATLFVRASLRAAAPIRIADVANVATSFPDFPGIARAAGLRVETRQARARDDAAIADVLDANGSDAALERVLPQVLDLCRRFPVYGP